MHTSYCCVLLFYLVRQRGIRCQRLQTIKCSFCSNGDSLEHRYANVARLSLKLLLEALGGSALCKRYQASKCRDTSSTASIDVRCRRLCRRCLRIAISALSTYQRHLMVCSLGQRMRRCLTRYNNNTNSKMSAAAIVSGSDNVWTVRTKARAYYVTRKQVTM